MDTLLRDIRYGFRSLWKRPGFTLVALIALALGIGANTAIFSLVNAVLVQPLPFRDPDQLVWAWGRFRQGSERASVAPGDFVDYREQNRSFEQLAAFFSIQFPINLTGNGEPERLNSAGVTGNYFEAMGVNAELGRTFALENEKAGNDQVAVLSHQLWQSQFGGDPNIVNKSIVLDGKKSLVLGVMPKEFNFPQGTEIWVPMNFDKGPEMKQRKAHFLRPVGRLKPGVTIAQAQADTDAIAARLEAQYPQSNEGCSIKLVGLRDQLVGDTRPTLFILLGSVGFVLLIACANVANLLLVRAAARQKEIALRTALGASRWRIVRQMITESLLLALMGGALGTVLAMWGVDLLVAVSGDNLPPTAQVRIDGTVLSFSLLVSLITGVLFGLAPALRTMKVNLSSSLKEGGRSTGEGVQRNLTRSFLIVAESAVAAVLLIGAGLLIRSLIRLQHTSPGFDSRNVLTMRLDLPEVKYPTSEKTASFFKQLETRIGGLPGVESTGMITELPLSGQPNDIPFFVEGRPPSTHQSFGADFRYVNTQYFKALRIPLLRGRNFTDLEVANSAPVILISDLLAKEAFPNEDPIGHRLAIGMGDLGIFEIIGVVGDIRHRALEREPFPAMYMPSFDRHWMNIVIRAQGDLGQLAAAVRNEVKAIDPDQPVAAVKPMDDWLAISVSSHRYRTLLLGLFAFIALVLASTGIYGVMSYSVSQRTHEIGVRMALGARRLDVLKLILQQGMVLVVIGLILGIFGAIGLTRVMSSVLYEITPKDPVTFVVVGLFLPVVAFFACYLPARRATKVDPLVALRYE